MEEKHQDEHRELTKDESTNSERSDLENGSVSREKKESVSKENLTEKGLRIAPETFLEKKASILEATREVEGKEKLDKEKKEIKQEKAESKIASTSLSPSVEHQLRKLKEMDRENQIKMICDLAFQKGINFAVKIAKKLDNPYVLDGVHDSLVDKLYEKLIEEGKLKKM